MTGNSLVRQAKLHPTWIRQESKVVGFYKAGIAVFPFNEFVAESRDPVRSTKCRIRNGLQSELFRVGFAHDDCKCIVETERFGPFDTEARLICVLNRLISNVRILDGGLFENSRQSRAGVFDISIHLSRRHRLMADYGSAEVQFAVDRKMRLALNLLGEHFAHNHLLSEIL